MTQCKIQCFYCLKEVERPCKEVKRSTKKHRNSFCSRKCMGRSRKERAFINKSLRQCRKNASTRNIFFQLTKEDLKNTLERQNNRCIYSGVKLNIHSKSNNFRPSIDRINSSLGYVPENIQFVSITSNYMKHKMSHLQAMNYCHLVAKFMASEGEEELKTNIHNNSR